MPDRSDASPTWLAEDVSFRAGGGIDLRAWLARRYGLPATAFDPVIMVRRSLDARPRHAPRWLVRCRFGLRLPTRERAAFLARHPQLRPHLPAGPLVRHRGREPVGGPAVVVGTGPAGLAAAWVLATHGWPVLVLERGAAMTERVAAVERFWQGGGLNPAANVQVGEGGAGTFSDGKLTSRTREGDWQDRVLDWLCQHGAPPNIRWDHRPHVGTDRIREVAAAAGRAIVAAGGQIRFGTTLTRLVRRGDRIEAIETRGPDGIQRMAVGAVILAPGNACRELMEHAADLGIGLTGKIFAAGLRIEHPQALVDRWQLGRFATVPGLAPASYQLSHRTGNGRTVYSFCMCPGGEIVNASDSADGLVVNGMSQHARASGWANAAFVVQTAAEIAAGDPLAGMRWQRALEHEAWVMGGRDHTAPAQHLDDFIAGRVGPRPVVASTRPGVRPAPLHELLPGPMVDALREAFVAFDRRLPGFIGQARVVVGIETRTSCPVQFIRDEAGRAAGLANLYLVGEGSGHAGGITTSAIDGMKVGARLVEAYAPAKPL